jgi:hypothetical protein
MGTACLVGRGVRLERNASPIFLPWTGHSVGLAGKSEAADNSPWEFDQANNQWRITDKYGKAHFLLVEFYFRDWNDL